MVPSFDLASQILNGLCIGGMRIKLVAKIPRFDVVEWESPSLKVSRHIIIVHSRHVLGLPIPVAGRQRSIHSLATRRTKSLDYCGDSFIVRRGILDVWQEGREVIARIFDHSILESFNRTAAVRFQ